MVRRTTNVKEVTRKRRSGSVEFDDLLEGPIDAKQCLHLGEDDDKGQGKFERKAELLAYYLRDDASSILNALADHLNSLADLPDEAPPQQLSFFGADEPYGRNDFDDGSDFSDTHRIMDSIRAGHTECEAIFIRELAKLMKLVGQTLDPQGKTPLQLVLKHRSRGKPKNWTKSFGKETSIRFAVLHWTHGYGKREAAIAKVMKDYRVSRAQIFRALSPKKKASVETRVELPSNGGKKKATASIGRHRNKRPSS